MQKFLESIIKIGSLIGILLVLLLAQGAINLSVYPEIRSQPYQPHFNLFQGLFMLGLGWKILKFKFTSDEKEETK